MIRDAGQTRFFMLRVLFGDEEEEEEEEEDDVKEPERKEREDVDGGGGDGGDGGESTSSDQDRRKRARTNRERQPPQANKKRLRAAPAAPPLFAIDGTKKTRSGPSLPRPAGPASTLDAQQWQTSEGVKKTILYHRKAIGTLGGARSLAVGPDVVDLVGVEKLLQLPQKIFSTILKRFGPVAQFAALAVAGSYFDLHLRQMLRHFGELICTGHQIPQNVQALDPPARRHRDIFRLLAEDCATRLLPRAQT